MAFPTRYMAPEALRHRSYSKKTDVWSYAVLRYEVWSIGAIPYFDIADDREVVRAVLSGERLPLPDNCPEAVYASMKHCWCTSPKDRPSMSDVQTSLQELFAELMLEAAKTECVICLDAEPVMALLPCGHRCVCEECGPILQGRACPICRTLVDEIKRIFG